MLNTQQIQQLQSAKSGAPSGVPNTSVGQPLNDASFKSWLNPTQSTNQPNVDMSMGSMLSKTFGGTIDAAKQTKKGFDQTVEGTKTGDISKIGRGVLNEAGGTINTLASPITNVLQNASKLPGISQGLDALKKHVLDPASNTISDSKSLQDLMQKYPNADEVLGNFMTILSTLAGGEKAPEIKTALSDATDTGINAVKQGVKTATNAVTDAAGNVINNATDSMGALKNKIIPTEDVNTTVGKVSQGKTADIQPFKQGISNLDTTGVKTYSDLTTKANDFIKSKSGETDSLLSKDTTPRKMQQLAVEQKVGDSVTSHNYVKDAIQQMKDYYTKINDVKNLAKINAYEKALDPVKGKGITLQDINNIARMHGTDLNAFNANGELSSGLSKQAAENTRVGLKETIKSKLSPEDRTAFTNNDKSVSDVYRVRDLSGKMAEKVNTLTQRLQKPNILQKIGGLFGKATKITGVGDFAAKLLGIDKVPGASTLSPVELEAKLSKNLQRINDALKKDDAGFTKDIQQIVKDESSATSFNEGTVPQTVSNSTNNNAATINKTSSRIIDDSLSQYKKTTISKGSQGGFAKIGGDVKSFSDFHPEDQAGLIEYANRVLNGEKVSVGDHKAVREIFDNYGFNLPDNPQKVANIIKTASDSAEESTFNANLDSNLKT